VNADPLFMNATTNNFTLQPNSPAIGAGVSVALTLNAATLAVRPVALVAPPCPLVDPDD